MSDKTYEQIDGATGFRVPIRLHDNGDGTYSPAPYEPGMGNISDAATVYGNGSAVAYLKGLGVFVGGAAVTPSDTQDLGFTARGLYVGATGDLKVKTANGDVFSLVAIPAGTFLPLAVLRVYATGQPGAIAGSVVALK